MTPLLPNLLRLITTGVTGATSQGGYQVWYRGSFFILLGMYFFLTLDPEPVSGRVLVLAIASSCFIWCDVKRYHRDINCVASFCAIAIFFLLLAAYAWLATLEFPLLLQEAIAWYRKFGTALLISSLAGAVVEEIVFRRFLQNQLQRFLSTNWAIFLTAAAFMFAHGFISLHLFFAGVAYGILASHLGSLHAAILIHATANIFGAASLGLTGVMNPQGYSNAVALGGSSALAQFSGIALLFIFMGGRAIYRRFRRPA